MKRQSIEAIYPLTPMQEGMLFHSLYDPESGVYVQQLDGILEGGVDEDAFRRAWQRALDRHPSLRTAFLSEGLEKPQQVVGRRVAMPIESEDWSDLPAAEREERLERYLEADRKRGFRMSRAPLMRLALFRIDDDTSHFVWTHHHILVDGWSVAILMQEVFDLYEAFRVGEEITLRDCRPYGDYIAWLGRQDLERARAFWEDAMRGVTGATSLAGLVPADPDAPADRHARTLVEVSAELSRSLEALARKCRVTLNTLVQAAWAIVLARYSREREVVFGVASAGRPGDVPGVESIVGLFINTLPMRVRIRPEQELVPWLRELQDRQSEQRQFEYTPLADIQRWSDVPSGVPMFESILAFENYPVDETRRGGREYSLEVRDLSAFERTNYPLTVQVSGSDHLTLRVLHEERRFEARSMRRVLEHFRHVLGEMASDPSHRLGEITLLTEEERRATLGEWNPRQDFEPGAATLHGRVRERLSRAPDAVVLEMDGWVLTAGELLRRSARLANLLRRRGIGAEVLVGVCLERSVDQLVAVLAVLEAGGAYVPLDPAYPPRRLRFMLADSGTRVVLTEERFLERLRESGPEGDGGAGWITLDGHREEITAQATEPPLPTEGSDHLAYAIYTSGSTGTPKGTLVTHRNVLRLLDATDEWFGFDENDVWSLFHSFAFDFSVWEIFGALLYGARLLVVPQGTTRNPERLFRFLAERRVTVLNQTPSAFRLLMTAEETLDDPPELALRWVVFGGEILEMESLRPWFARHGDERPQLVNMYGITETTVHVTYRPLSVADLGGGSVIGVPIPDLVVYAGDLDLRLLPPGVVGEILVGGAGVIRGYLGRPGLTAERFVPDPWSEEPGRRLYRSGDLCRRLEDGELEYLRRVDHQVKLRGFRVETGEIQAALVRHPQVRSAAVILREDSPGHEYLAAYVVPDLEKDAGDGAGEPFGDDRVEQWRRVHQEAYSAGFESSDAAFDAAGWSSSYTGEPLSTEEMDEWVEATVERVLALEPRRVLEIGCGVGRLLRRIAPHCEQYWATDLSEAALARVRRRLDEDASLPENRVVLLDRPAHDFDQIAEGAFDVVILNSVVQYFPGIDYFLDVLRQTLPRVAPGGAVYLGDLRNLRLQETFQTGVELAKAPPDLDAGALAVRVRRGIEGEEELFLDPDLFEALRSDLPRVSRVSTELRRGRHHNEFTAFRYDATLFVEEGPRERRDARVVVYEEGEEGWRDLELVRERLAEEGPELLRVEGVPNARVAPHVRVRSLLETHPDLEDVAELEAEAERAAVQAGPAVEPEEVWRLATELGYEATVGWSRRGPDRFDAVLRRRGVTALHSAAESPASDGAAGRQPLERFANDPLRAVRIQALVPRLRSHLEERVPQWMVPAHIIALQELPLSTNGKVDHRALPAPESGRGELREPYLAPRTDEEEALAAVWSEVLGVDRVGVHDNFFALGGDSIRSIRIQSMARKRGVELSLQDLFAAPTIAELVARGNGRDAQGAEPDALPNGPFSQIGAEDRAQLDESIEDAFPLSRMQAGMLFHSELDPETSVYHDVFTSHLRAPLDVDLLEDALRELVRRHPALRTSFDLTRFAEPLQLVHAEAGATFAFEDWSDLAEEECADRIDRWMAEEKQHRFDWRRPGLVRFHVHRRDAETFQLTVSCHHSVLDGWSVAILLTELFKLYFGRLHPERPMPVSPPPEAGIADQVALERRALRSEETRRFWERTLRGPEATRLPRAPDPGPREIRTREVPLPRRVTEGLSELSRTLDMPVKTVLLTAHLRALAAVTGATDVVTGIVSSSRPERFDGDRALGLFLNNLPFPASLEPGTWEDLVRRTFRRERETLAHRWFPIAEIQRMNGGVPPFEAVFNFVHFHAYQAIQEAGEIEFLGGEFASETNFTLLVNFSLDISASEVHLELDYDAGQISEDQVDRMAACYRTALEQMATSPTTGHHLQPLLVDGEGPSGGSATAEPYPADRTLDELVAEQADRTPDAIALSFRDESISYAELRRRTARLAGELGRRGVAPGVTVGVCLERSPEMVVALLGVLEAGGAYVPLDPSHPVQRLEHCLRDSGARLLLTGAGAGDEIPAAGLDVVRVEASPADGVATPPASPANPEDLAYVIYTSGSTGQPKGVMVPHRTVCNFLTSMRRRPGLEASDTLLPVTTVSFDIAALELFLPLTTGARAALVPREVTADGALLAEALERLGATVMQATPATWRLLVESGWSGRPCLKALCGGEALPDDLARELTSRCGSLWNLYGPTETTIWSAVQPVSGPRSPVPIGRPIANTALHVVSPFLQPLPVAAAGELLIGGAGLARGYRGRPGLTAERFVPDPFSDRPGARLYRTGDRVRRAEDGSLEFLGRIDFQVKVRGFRIELGEIESVLLDHPGVRRCVVGLRSAGTGDAALVCGVVPEEGAAPEAAGLREHLSARLPDYMVPSRFKVLESLPLQANGKLDRRAALALLGDAQPTGRAPYVPPSTAAERLVAEVWGRLLEVESVGVRDSFFDLGGHSITATQLVARLRDLFQVDLQLARLFDDPTVEGVVARLAEVWGSREIVEEVAGAALEVRDLSDEQVSRLLAEEEAVEVGGTASR